MRVSLRVLCVVSLAGYASVAPAPRLAAQASTAPTGCADPVDQRPAGGTCVATVNGKVIDETGAPLSNLPISVCATACYYGKTNEEGAFSVRVYSHLLVNQYSTSVHGRPDHADYYTPLPRSSGDTYRYATPLVLPRMPARGPTIATNGSAQKIVAGDVTLHLDAGTTVDISLDDRMLGDIGSQLRPVGIADPKKMPFVDPAAPPALLYGFAPFEVRFSRKVAVSFVNTKKLPAGAAVDVLGMHGLLAGQPPAARFSPVATARVSADGARIDMDPGQGVLTLTWLALRPK